MRGVAELMLIKQRQNENYTHSEITRLWHYSIREELSNKHPDA